MSVLLDDGVQRMVELGSLALLAVTVLIAVALLYRFAEGRSILEGLRERFVWGIPWATATVIVFLWMIFQFLQGGGADDGPVVIGFRSWSFWYPQGIILSSFTHSSESHLIGNLFGTLAFAPIVEYVWGHYPDESEDGRLPSWTRHPAARVGLFVAVTMFVGVLSAMFVPVAAVGFSTVVFAYAGAAVVLRPLATIGAIVGIRVIRLLYEAATSPVGTFRSQQVFASPSWVDVSIQGHLYGFLAGVLIAVLLLRYRDRLPDIRYVFFAAIVFLVARSMQSIYWELGNDRFILFRALGTAAVVFLATLVTLAITDRDGPSIPRTGFSTRPVALGLLVATILVVSLAGMVFNFGSVTAGPEAEDGLDVRDYTVTYAENVENQYLAGTPRAGGIGPPSITVSGVIVVSEQRDAWERVATAGQLRSEGRTTVVVGDATWREQIVVSRTEWEFVDGNVTYNVFAFGENRGPVTLFQAPAANTSTVVDNRSFRIEPGAGFDNYTLTVTEDGESVGTTRIPDDNETATVDGITFERDENRLAVRYEGTNFTLARFRTGGRL